MSRHRQESATSVAHFPKKPDLQREIELVVAVGHVGEWSHEGDALCLVWGNGVGIDLTHRGVQNVAKQARPWDVAKGLISQLPSASSLRSLSSATLSQARSHST